MWRNPSSTSWWFVPVLMVVGLGAFVALLSAGEDVLALVVLLVVFGVVLAFVIADPFVTRRRSRVVREQLTPDRVAVHVDLDRLATLANSGHPKAHAAAAGLVQRSFPRLTKADALAVVVTAVPTPWVRDGATPR